MPAFHRLHDVASRFDIDLIDRYLERRDWHVSEDSNITFSVQGLHHTLTSEASKMYWLERIYSPQAAAAHRNGDFHIHTLRFLGAYCMGWDLRDLLKTGIQGASGKFESKPAWHLRSALGQIVNFFYTLQGESAGAQAFSNFDTLLAPFIWDNPYLSELWEVTAKYGTPYFANFINSGMKPEDARSLCCRLRIDTRELRKRGEGFFAAAPLTGSIGVVTVNMPRHIRLDPDPNDLLKVQAPVFYDHTDVQRVPRLRILCGWKRKHLPALRRHLRSLFKGCRISPARPAMESGKTGRISAAEGLQDLKIGPLKNSQRYYFIEERRVKCRYKNCGTIWMRTKSNMS